MGRLEGVLSGKLPDYHGRISLGRKNGMVVNRKAHSRPEMVGHETPRGMTDGCCLWGSNRPAGKAEPPSCVLINTSA